MSIKTLPEGFSFKFGSEGKKESVNDLFLKTATTPTFPFLRLKLKAESVSEDFSFDLHLDKKIYDFMKLSLQTDEILFFSQPGGPLGQWSFDMILAINVAAKFKVISDVKDWIANSRKCMAKLLNEEKIEPEKTILDGKINAEKILTACDLKDAVDATPIVFEAAKEAIKEKIMDKDTIIYRLAMAIYHSNRGVDKLIIPQLDDPSSSYLKLVNSTFYKENISYFVDVLELPLDARLQTIKVLMTFMIGGYAYYKVIGDT